ncbi:uncharacterized protein LOC115885785 isoform X2 [Sitophilus oryzae]|uniref:Uncharacterized protein LOC115885785 isoform X2 n=1 Tax=Sitophilus oryzae TaxID=7048 RepID=A0A6J2YCM6_SITOR|nr:uncharacterized protein LOC115885785 isoform X2 [Sitophilus oryzae]
MNTETDKGNISHGSTSVKKVHLTNISQITCREKDKSAELDNICKEYMKKRLTCKPQDILNPAMHKLPKYYKHGLKNSSNDTQNTIVNYIIAALIITSLGAAILEFYRAKIYTPAQNGRKGLKPPLNRKCSLADLTVLKHHRKELVRRESILEHHFESKDEDLTTMKFQGSTPSPLHRRCSFPVNFPSNDLCRSGLNSPSRKMSVTADASRRYSMLNSVINIGGRKLSMVADGYGEDIWKNGSYCEDSSPERKHHSRLVHRH